MKKILLILSGFEFLAQEELFDRINRIDRIKEKGSAARVTVKHS
ncbi:MAG: hypothetical protein AB9866_04800 [Syntrophobacteraceae bacterium]